MAQRSPRRLSLISSSGSRSRESPSRHGSQPASRRQRRQRRTTSSQPLRLFNGLMKPFERFKSSKSSNSPTPFSFGDGSQTRTAESLEPLVSQLRQQQQTRLGQQQQRPRTPTRRRNRTRSQSRANTPVSSPLPPLVVDNRRNPNFQSPPSSRQSRPLTSPSPSYTPTSPVSSRPNRVTKKPRRRFSPMIYGARLLILGVGIGVISGTVLSVLSSLGRLGESSAATSSASLTLETLSEGTTTTGGVETLPLSVQLNQELKSLQQKILALTSGNSDLKPGVLLVDLDTGGYVDINSESTFPAASTIKVPILVAFFQAVDDGRITLNEVLTMEDQHIAGGSGDMQYQPSGSEYTALETATKMIVISDNTATNILIERLGGAEVLNQKFLDWGLKNSVIRDVLPDLRGTNKTTPRDLVNLLSQLNQGGLVSMKSRDRILRIMERTENNSLLASGLGRGAVIAHKTGNLKSVSADVGLIDLANGKRYLLATIVERSEEDSGAESLIRNISKTIYEEFTREAKAEEELTENSEETENEAE